MFRNMLRLAFAAWPVGLGSGESRRSPWAPGPTFLVAMGSAALMTVTLNFSMSSIANDGDLTIDPTRLIQGIVGGIGFLGAGAIMSGDESGAIARRR